MRILAFVSMTEGTGRTTLTTELAAVVESSGDDDAAHVIVAGESETTEPHTGPSAGAAVIVTNAVEMGEAFERLRRDGVQRALVDVDSCDPDVIRSVAADADLIAIPVLPSVRDADAIDATVQAIQTLGKRFLFVPNRVGPKGLSATAVMTLTQHGQVCPIPVPRLDGLANGSPPAADPDDASAPDVMTRLWTFLSQQLDRQESADSSVAPQRSRATQRRKYPRWPAKWQVTLQSGDQTAIGRAQNVSAGGVMILTQMPLEVGDTARIEIPSLGAFTAGVVHRNDSRYGLAFAISDEEQADLAMRLEETFARRSAPPPRTADDVEIEVEVEAEVPPARVADAAPNPLPPRRVAVAPADLEVGSDRASHPEASWTPISGDPKVLGGTVITVANPKGGSGKSTIAMHLVVALMRAGCRVASVDLDPGQWTLTRYLDNRRAFAEADGHDLPQPIAHSVFETDVDAQAESTLRHLKKVADVIVIDTAGRISPLTQIAHALADVLITPLNDSFVDLDVLARLDPTTLAFEAASPYGELITQIRTKKAEAGLGQSDWIVLRNRLTNLDARNKRDMADAVNGLAHHLQFRIGPGLSERTIYRQLFPHGLTLSDLRAAGAPLTMSQVAAREELRNLLACLFPSSDACSPSNVARTA